MQFFLIFFDCYIEVLEIGYFNNVGLESIFLQKDKVIFFGKLVFVYVGLIFYEFFGECFI